MQWYNLGNCRDHRPIVISRSNRLKSVRIDAPGHFFEAIQKRYMETRVCTSCACNPN